jgi:hypothetical protein
MAHQKARSAALQAPRERVPFRSRLMPAGGRLRRMRSAFASFLFCALIAAASASTIMVVPIYEPLSLHGTDGDDAISEIGEALQATVMARPMALTGAFPEVLVDAIASSHKIPTNNENYEVEEANLLILCGIGISGEMTEGGLLVKIDIESITIPVEVDLTSRQVLKLALVALRKTLEIYQQPQPQVLTVVVEILGASEGTAPLKDLGTKFTIGEPAGGN